MIEHHVRAVYVTLNGKTRMRKQVTCAMSGKTFTILHDRSVCPTCQQSFNLMGQQLSR